MNYTNAEMCDMYYVCVFMKNDTLLPVDFPQRVALYQWMQDKIAQNPQFLAQVVYIDEITFTRNAIINFHISHIWAEENPHEIMDGRHQHQFSVNVWAEIVEDHLVGPHFLPMRLNGDVYRHFLEEELDRPRCAGCHAVLVSWPRLITLMGKGSIPGESSTSPSRPPREIGAHISVPRTTVPITSLQ
ncbi:hypothetical protein CBL_01912 [Carabus blaptoides fortunei]